MVLIATVFAVITASAQSGWQQLQVSSGLNADIVAEVFNPEQVATNYPAKYYLVGGVDNGDVGLLLKGTYSWTTSQYVGHVLFVQGALDDEEAKGLPAEMPLTSQNGNKYYIDYAANNSLHLTKEGATGTLVLQSPTQTSQLWLLGVSGNGISQVDVTVNYNDGTSTTASLSYPDWWNSNETNAYEAFSYLNRVKYDDGKVDGTSYKSTTDRRGQVHLDEYKIDTDNTKTIVSVTVKEKTAGKQLNILGISTGDSPVLVSEGFNEDIIAETADVKASASTGIDGYKNTNTIEVQNGLPADGNIVCASGTTYKTDYAALNTAKLSSATRTVEVAFAGSPNCSQIALLGTAGSGPQTIKVVVNYTDGTSADEQQVVFPNWDSTPENPAYGPIQRCDQWSQYGINTGKFYLYERTVNADLEKTVKSLTLTATGGDPVIIGFSMNGESQEPGDDTESLPFTDTFDDETSLNRYLIVDNNKDKSTWTFGHDHVGYLSSMYNGADDYLITPELPLKAGKYYELRYLTWSYSNSWTERLETLIGQGTDPTNYTIIEPAFDITGGPANTLTRSSIVTVNADGNYRFAFHAVSAYPDFWLFIDDLIIREIDADTPVAATELSVAAQPEGDFEAVLTFKAPEVNIAGGKLTKIDHVNIYRNEELIGTTNAQPGAVTTYTDKSMTISGYMTYKVTACVGDIEGQESSSVTVFVGEDSPVSPHVSVNDHADGTALLTWVPEELGYNKLYVNNERMFYDIYQADAATNQWKLIKEGFQGTEYNVNIPITGEQTLSGFGVVARNKTGKSSMATVKAVAGKPYTLPFKETFADGHLDNPMWILDGNGQNDYWQLTKLQDIDGSGGCAVFQAHYANDYSTYESGKIGPLSEAKNLHLLYYYNFNINHYNGNTLKVIVISPDGTQKTVSELHSEDHTTNQWYIDEVDLSEFSQQPYIRLSFLAEEKQAGEAILLDGVRLRDIKDYDLETILYGPTTAKTGEEQTFYVLVNNLGNKAAEGFTVALHAGDSILTQPAGEKLEMGQARYYTFKYTFGVNEVVDDEPIEVFGLADFDADQLPEDNTSFSKWVTLVLPSVSAVKDLQAVAGDEDIQLSWSAPGETGSVEESFEDFSTWQDGGITSKNNTGFIGNWKVVDGDKNPVVEPETFTLPTGIEPQAFIIVKPSEVAGITNDSRYQPHSGENYILSPNTTSGNCNDWLISPVLSGEAQTITFYAKMAPLTSYSSRQEFNVLYSTTGNDPEDFVQIGETYKERDKNNWTEYSVDLPAGARYFAIQSVMRYGMGGLMLDDICFEAGALPIDHYNIYRDRHFLAATTAEGQTTYTDSDNDEQEHTYHVSVVYDDGTESALSNAAVASFPTAIATIPAENVNGKDVYDLQGRRIIDTPLSKGVYIVGGRKVVVK